MEQASQPAAWYADPSGRHEQRYWSGSGWTEHVADRGQQSVDPLAPGPAPPPGPAPQAGGWQQPPPQAPGGAPWPGPGWGGGVGQPASLGPRFLARLIDFVLLGIVSAIIGGVIVAGLIIGSPETFF